MIKIALPGAAGRMGGMLIKTIAAASDLALVAATDRPDSPHIGETSVLLLLVNPPACCLAITHKPSLPRPMW